MDKEEAMDKFEKIILEAVKKNGEQEVYIDDDIAEALINYDEMMENYFKAQFSPKS